jgi:hypothetical protein
MNPDDFFTDDLDAFLGWPVTDESAWLIHELLRLIAERWAAHHGDQIMRYLDDHRLPPRDPDHPWH